jgi:site-specific DNA recombinase
MHVALYFRVSTDEQVDQGYSLENQKDRLIAFAKSQGWDEYQLYMDDGYTGTNMDRPGLKRMVRHIEEKQVTAVVVLKLDRLSRKQKDALYLLEDVFDKNNVIFKSATEPFDTSTPLGKAMIGVLAVFAQLERDMIVERTTAGRRQRVSQGKWHGGPVPFGYTWNKDAQELEIAHDEAKIVQEIFTRYQQGQSRLAIAEWATERTKARVFDHNRIREFLARPIYMGMLTNAGLLVDGNHEGIIDPEQWYAVQVESLRRKEGLSPIGEYLLTGLLKCGVCGSGVVHVKRNTPKNGKMYSYELYACKQQHVRYKDRTNHCTLGYFKRTAIEEFVIDRIKEGSVHPDELRKEIDRNGDRDDSKASGSIVTKIDVITSQLGNLYDAMQSATGSEA